jgi:hypothetical protein
MQFFQTEKAKWDARLAKVKCFEEELKLAITFFAAIGSAAFFFRQLFSGTLGIAKMSETGGGAGLAMVEPHTLGHGLGSLSGSLHLSSPTLSLPATMPVSVAAPSAVGTWFFGIVALGLVCLTAYFLIRVIKKYSAKQPNTPSDGTQA